MSNNKIIKVGANIVGGVTKQTLANALFPCLPIVGEILGPIITAITEDIAGRMLSQSENNKLIFVYKGIISEIQQRLDSGEQPRRDDAYYIQDQYLQSSASKLLEEVLLKTKQEYEGKKLTHYCYFWPNVCFDNSISYETANAIISQYASLTFQQIQILTYLNEGHIIPLDEWEYTMLHHGAMTPYFTFYSDCLHLYNNRLASQPFNKHGIQLGTPKICISPAGKLMCRLLELNYSKEDNNTEDTVKKIIAIVNSVQSQKEA